MWLLALTKNDLSYHSQSAAAVDIEIRTRNSPLSVS